MGPRAKAYIAAVNAAVDGDADSWDVAGDALEEIGETKRAGIARAIAVSARREGRPVFADPGMLFYGRSQDMGSTCVVTSRDWVEGRLI